MTDYKYRVGDIVYIQTYTGLENLKAKLITNYTSDEFNHPSRPHKRCVVYILDDYPWTKDPENRLGDVAEIELSREVLA